MNRRRSRLLLSRLSRACASAVGASVADVPLWLVLFGSIGATRVWTSSSIMAVPRQAFARLGSVPRKLSSCGQCSGFWIGLAIGSLVHFRQSHDMQATAVVALLIALATSFVSSFEIGD